MMYGKKNDMTKTPMGKAMGKAKKMLIIVGDEDTDPVTGAPPMGQKKMTKANKKPKKNK